MVFLFNLFWSLFKGEAFWRQSMAGDDARMADAADAAGAWQLGQGAAGRLSLGVRLQRAGCARRISFRRTSHPRRGLRSEGARHERHPPLHGCRARSSPSGGSGISGLFAKPWLEEGATKRPAGGMSTTSLPASKVGLGVFLAVVGSLFALLISAYSMRMPVGDWRPLPLPRVLWFNTAMLVLSSVALQWAERAARRGGGWKASGRRSRCRRHYARLSDRTACWLGGN